MSFANSDSFILCLQFGFLLFLFLVWFLWLGLPILFWIKVVTVGILVLFLNLEEMLSAFHHWIWCYLWTCHICSLLCWGMFPLCPLSEQFIINGCWVLSKDCCAPTEMIIWCSFFNLLMWCFTLLDLRILNYPCIPGINLTWSWCMILLMYCLIQFAKILLRIFASMFVSDAGL